MITMTRTPLDLEDWYDPTHPVRTTLRLFSEQRWRMTGAAFTYAVKHSPVWVMPVLTAQVIDIVVDERPSPSSGSSRRSWPCSSCRTFR